jgi:hypothetical protein
LQRTTGWKFFWVFGSFLLGYKCEEGGVEGLQDPHHVMRFLNKIPYVFSDHLLVVVNEINNKSIRAQGFVVRDFHHNKV